MARVKTKKEEKPEEVQVAEAQELVASSNEEREVPEEKPEVVEDKPEAIEESEAKEDEPIPSIEAPKQDEAQPSNGVIPSYADAILKTFMNYPELYVSPKGCVFTSNSKPCRAAGAILYKNPYYIK